MRKEKRKESLFSADDEYCKPYINGIKFKSSNNVSPGKERGLNGERKGKRYGDVYGIGTGYVPFSARPARAVQQMYFRGATNGSILRCHRGSYSCSIIVMLLSYAQKGTESKKQTIEELCCECIKWTIHPTCSKRIKSSVSLSDCLSHSTRKNSFCDPFSFCFDCPSCPPSLFLFHFHSISHLFNTQCELAHTVVHHSIIVLV